MQDYSKLVQALNRLWQVQDTDLEDWVYGSQQAMHDAAAAIEALQAEIRESMQKCAECGDEQEQKVKELQAEVQFYKALADEWKSSSENRERLLGLYRAEQAKHFYSAIDDNGRTIENPCVCMNIPVFPDSSESPNS